jgi:alanine dehydrogenase
MASRLGAKVIVLERNEAKITKLLTRPRYVTPSCKHNSNVEAGTDIMVLKFDPTVLRVHLPLADIVVCAAYVDGRKSEKLILKNDIRTMKPGSVIVDLAIDQGGSTDGSYATDHDDPTYDYEGITMYCVANVPGVVPRTSTPALIDATMPYIDDLIEHGTMDSMAVAHGGLNVAGGTIVHPALNSL